jgi:hypothetical protein
VQVCLPPQRIGPYALEEIVVYQAGALDKDSRRSGRFVSGQYRHILMSGSMIQSLRSWVKPTVAAGTAMAMVYFGDF